MKQGDIKPSWPLLLMNLALSAVGTFLGYVMVFADEFLIKLFGAMFLVSLPLYLFSVLFHGIPRRGNCPECGGKIESAFAEASNILCKGCNSYLDVAGSKAFNSDPTRIESEPTYAVPLPFPGLGVVTHPTIALSAEDKIQEILLTKKGEIREIEPRWPAGCCVCGKRAVRYGTYSRIFLKAGKVRDVEMVLTVRGVPYCGEHDNGVKIDHVRFATPGDYTDIGLFFRSLGYRNAYLKANPSHWESAAPVANEQLFQEGRSSLWLRQMGKADQLLSRAIEAQSQSALSLAYRSFLKRMNMDLPGALEDADRAVSLAPECFEAHAARTVALLTDRERLVDAVEAYEKASHFSPCDADGHYINLVIYLLFAEMLINSVEEPDEVILNFKLTPVARAATRLLDGYPLLALGELKDTDESLLWFIAMGLAFYRLGKFSSAATAFKEVIDSLGGGGETYYTASLNHLLLEAEKSQNAPSEEQ